MTNPTHSDTRTYFAPDEKRTDKYLEKMAQLLVELMIQALYGVEDSFVMKLAVSDGHSINATFRASRSVVTWQMNVEFYSDSMLPSKADFFDKDNPTVYPFKLVCTKSGKKACTYQIKNEYRVCKTFIIKQS